MVVLGQAGVADGLGGLGVQRAGELCIPVQYAAGIAHLVVNVPGVGDALGNVGGVGGDLGGHDALLYVFHIGQCQMLGGGHIAQEGRTAGGCHCAADGSGDVVVAGGDIGDQRSQHIEGCAHADALLHLHVGGDLIQGHMAGTLHHYLHVVRPCTLGQLAQTHQFLDLAHIGGVSQTAGTAGIAQRDGHIMLGADLADLVKVLVEGVLVAGHAHPRKHQRAAAAHDVHLALVLADLLDGLAGNAAVQGDKVHAVLCVQAHHIDEVLCSQLSQIPLVVDDRIIHRHSADHHRALVGQLLAEGLGVAVAGQIHNGFCAHVHGAHHLLHLNVVVLAVAGDAKVHVDLGAQHGANALGIQALVVLVGGDGYLALGDPLADLLGGAVFLFGYDLHLRGDDALAGGIHLGGISLHTLCSSK